MFGLLEAAILAFTLSVDAFAVAFAYGCKRIKIPAISAWIINIICTGVTGLSFWIGALLAPFIPTWMALGISFLILLSVGIVKLWESIKKTATVDVPESISPKEAAVLAVSLSLDGFAVGFGAALLGFNAWAVVLFSFLANGIALYFGAALGNRLARSLPFNISWSTGIMLIGLAFTRLF